MGMLGVFGYRYQPWGSLRVGMSSYEEFDWMERETRQQRAALGRERERECVSSMTRWGLYWDAPKPNWAPVAI